MTDSAARQPLITAAIICFNRADMVRDSIESVFRQTFTDYELVLVDDASTDGSADILREFADRATVVVREENGGEMAARNSAMAVSRGEYMCFLDSDDEWFPWTLATYVDAIQRHNRPAVLGGSMFEFQDPQQIRQVEQTPYAETVASCYFTGHHYLGVVGSVIRRDEIERVGRFVDVRLVGPDADLMYRVGDRPGMVKIESPRTFAYRKHFGNIMGNFGMRYGGALQWIVSEVEGKYPGGDALRRDRLRHITLHVRSISVQCLQHRNYRMGWDLYRRTFRWNLFLGRWWYLLSFPCMLVCPPLVTLRTWYFRRKRSRAAQADSSLAAGMPSR